jgi:hypothetical protein
MLTEDGRIGPEDASATGIRAQDFGEADRDGDGYVDVDEFHAWLRASGPLA